MRQALVILAFGAFALTAFALWPRDSATRVDACGPVDEKPTESSIEAAAQTTVCLLNRERTTRGLAAFRENGILDATSVEHSQDMVKAGYFEHTSPDGRTVQDRLRAAGYARGVNASSGENIAYGVGQKATPAAIVRIWMHSPPHRADILRPAFTEIGIGVVLGAPGVAGSKQRDSATYTTDFGGVPDASLPNG